MREKEKERLRERGKERKRERDAYWEYLKEKKTGRSGIGIRDGDEYVQT